MADITNDLFDSIDEEDSLDDDDTSQGIIKKNLLVDFATSGGKLMRHSVAHTHSRERMHVHLRIRPFTSKEMEQGESQECMEISQPSSLLMRAPKDSFTFKSSQRGFSLLTHKFTFTRIFGEDTSQKEFFDDTMLGTVKDFIDGQNCLVFTYGVTNSGKTYTIQGHPQDGGILPRSLDVIFNSLEGRLYPGNRLKPRYFCDVAKLDQRQQKTEDFVKESVLAMANQRSGKQDMTQDSLDDADDSKASNYTTATEDSHSEISLHSVTDYAGVSNVLDDIRCRIPDDTSVDVEAQGPLKFSVWVSFAEIYNEYVYDLLEAIPKGKKVRRQPLKFAEDKTGQTYIKGLKEISVHSADEAYKIVKIGQQNLSIAETKLNQCSSRSHCIFSVKILRVVDVDNPHVARVSQLSFCDLAGSERYMRTQNTGDRMKEAGNINTSLLTLGKCIHTLRYNQNHPKSQPKIIPLRESKLTRLFRSFLMGKGKASMIVNVNQCASGFDETIQVLKFSAIAKQVTTVTSKLDNTWKLPSMGGASRLASGRELSLGLGQSLSQGRASVAWATPGPHHPDTTLDLTTVDESYLEEEEEEEEDEDEQSTPRDSVLNAQPRSGLLALVETLQKQIIEQKKRMMLMEVQIREEVCQEMAQQLVTMEDDYKNQLEQERVTTEEMYEKRLEMFEKSVLKRRKRPRPDNDDDELASSLLHAERVKVQEQDVKIEELQDKLNETEVVIQNLKLNLKEADKELAVKLAAAVSESSDLRRQLQSSSEEHSCVVSAQDVKIEALQSKLNETEVVIQDLKLNLKEADKELAVKLAAAVSESSDLRRQLQSSSDEHSGVVSALDVKIEELQSKLNETEVVNQGLKLNLKEADKELAVKLAAAVSESCDLRRQLQSSSEEHSGVVSAMDVKIEELQDKLNETEVVIQDLKLNLKEADKELAVKLAVAVSESSDLRRQLQSSSEEHSGVVSAMDVKIEELQDKLNETEVVIQDLKLNLKEADKELAVKLAASVSESSDLRRQLQSSSDEHSGVVSALDVKIEELQSKLNETEVLNQGLNLNLKEADKELAVKLAAAVSESSDLRRQLQSSSEEHCGVVSALDVKIEELQSKLNETEVVNQGLKLNLKEADKELAVKLAAAVSESSDLRRQLQSSSEEHSGVVSALDVKIEALQSKLNETEVMNQGLKLSLKEADKELAVKLAAAVSESSDLRRQLQSSSDEHSGVVSALDVKIEALQSKLNETEVMNQGLKLSLKEADKELAVKLAAAVSESSDLRRQLQSSSEEHSGVVSALDVKIEELQSKLKETEVVNQGLKLNLKEADKELAVKLDAAVSESSDLRRQLQSSSEEHSGVVSALDVKIEELQSKLNETEVVNQGLKLNLKEADKELAVKLAAVVSESSDLRRQLQSSSEEHSGVVSALNVKNEELQRKLNETKVVIQDLKLNLKEAETKAPARSPSPEPTQESPDLFDVKDQESFHQPGRRRTRVEMDLTPLQKKPVRKIRPRKAKKRKSTEPIQDYENSKPLEATTASGRGTRAALSKIGDLLQNTPLAKSAKRLVESASARMTSPPKSPRLETVAYLPTTEKKRKRRLLKTDISVPFANSPFDVVNTGESSKGDNTHNIVTRKLRSRNTRV